MTSLDEKAERAARKARKAKVKARKAKAKARKGRLAGKRAKLQMVKGASVTPIASARWKCWDGHLNKARSRFCTSCGERRGIDRLTAVKAADPMSRHPRWAELQRETDSGRYAALYQRIYDETAGRDPQGQVAFIAKAHGFRSVDDLIASETDAAAQAVYRHMANPRLYPEGGQTA